jgi:hypothetical protein
VLSAKYRELFRIRELHRGICVSVLSGPAWRSLFVTERYDWVNAHGAAGRDVAGG